MKEPANSCAPVRMSSETGSSFLFVGVGMLLKPTERAIAEVESGLGQGKKQRNVCFHGEKVKDKRINLQSDTQRGRSTKQNKEKGH